MTTFERREELRDTFAGMAAVYHGARPRYPEALLDDLVGLAGLEQGSLVLEVGAGTGIATTAHSPPEACASSRSSVRPS